MAKFDDGGQVYPSQEKVADNTTGLVHVVVHPGITLLDYFAGQALMGHLEDSSLDGDNSQYAEWSYNLAEAMIAEKRRRESST